MSLKVLLRFKLILIFFIKPYFVFAEPFIVLEYRANGNMLVDSENPFLSNKNFSTKHKVKKNETLTDIILKYYGFKNFNRDILSLSIVHFNKHAFVRKNPNFLFANKTLYLPSLNQIQNLVLKLPKDKINSGNNDDRADQIYFFGG